jgi:O-antigen/teichoic acid export membrane protein
MVKIPLARFASGMPEGAFPTTLALLLRVLFQALTFVLVSRRLGVESYGQFVAVVALAVLLAPLATAGTEFILLRMIALNQAIARIAIGAGLCVVASAGTAVASLAFLLCAAILPDLSWLVLACVVLSDVLLIPITDLGWRSFQGAANMRAAAALRLVPASARFLAALVFALPSRQADLETWACLYAAGSAAAAVIVLGITCRHFGRPATNRSLLAKGLREGWYFAANGVSERITNDADKFMTAALGGASAAGAYAAGYRIVEIFNVPLASVIMASNAKIFRAGADGPIRDALRGLLLVVVAYGIAVAVVLIAAAGFVKVLLGPDFGTAEPAVMALSCLPLLYGIRCSLWLALAATGRHSARTTAQFAVAVLNVGANAALIPVLGWVGAVCATLGSEFLLCVMFVFGLRRKPGLAKCDPLPADDRTG